MPDREIDLKKAMDRFFSEQVLPEDEKLLTQVIYNVYEKGLRDFQSVFDASDRYRRYVRGEAQRKYSNTDISSRQYNVVQSNLASCMPVISDSFIKPTLYSVSPDDTDSAEALALRVDQVLKDSGILGKRKQRIIYDLLVDGTTYFKNIFDGTDAKIVHLDNRRILFDASVKDIHDSFYVLDCTVDTIGNTKRMFPKAKFFDKAEGNLDRLPAEQTRPSGPPQPGISNTDPSRPQLNTSAQGAGWVDAPYLGNNKLIRIEAWVKDLTETRPGSGELKYPYGRLVTIAVVKESPDVTHPYILLKDVENPYEHLYESTGQFPFVQIKCHDSGENLWGESEIAYYLNLQDAINEVLTILHTNWILNNNTITVSKKGVGTDEISNTPGLHIEITDSEVQDVRAVFTRIPAPDVSSGALNLLQIYTSLADKSSGISDVARGSAPGSASGVAIEQLQSKSDSRFLFIAQNINEGLIEAYKHTAYILQEFDSEPTYLRNENITVDEGDISNQYVEYDPTETESVKFKCSVSRMMNPNTAYQLLQLSANLDAVMQGLGSLPLTYTEDKSLVNSYNKILETNRRIAMEAQQRELAARKEQTNSTVAGKLASKQMEIDAKMQSNINNEEEVE